MMEQAHISQASGVRTGAQLVADFLVAHGLYRIYGLTGGHTKPIWDRATRAGIEVVDVRHEAAALHMAQAAAELTGRVAVATVTTGPGVTNAMSGIAAAFLARVPVLLIAGLPPRPQLGRGAFEELPHVDLVRPITRYAATVRDPHNLLRQLHAALRAAVGEDSAPGPSFLDIPIDVLRATIPESAVERWWLNPLTPIIRMPDPTSIAAAARLVRASRRPVVISGRPALAARSAVSDFLDATGAFHLETRESRGLLPSSHPADASALRATVMQQADLVITLGRRFDFELGYGSPVVFPQACPIIRIGLWGEDVAENRPATVAVRSDIEPALRELIGAGAAPDDLDHDWQDALRSQHRAKVAALRTTMAEQSVAEDGRIHPLQLIAAVNECLDEEDVAVADGGDILSFAAIGLRPGRVLQTGTFGCLGVGVPFAVAAALVCPERRVIAVIGDGAFGFNALEIETAVRRKAKAVFVVSNNEAWNIERHDRIENFANDLFNTELPGCRYDLLARSLGAYGEHVSHAEDLVPAIRRGLDNAPAVIDVATSGLPMSPDFRNGLAEIPDHQALRRWSDADARRLAGD